MGKSFQWHCEHLLKAIHSSIFPMFHYFIFIQTSAIYQENCIGDPEDDGKRAIKWTELDKSLNRLDDLFADRVEEPLNLGNDRSLEDYRSAV